MPATPSIHTFGAFRLDPAERLLLRDGQPVALTPKVFDLLVYLVERDGRLVTKQELLSTLWPDAFVEEGNLAYTVSTLRKALGDGINGAQYIQTVPTRGYRFVAPVTHVTATSARSTDAGAAVPGARTPYRRALVAGAVTVATVLAAVLVTELRQPHAPVAAHFTIPVPEWTPATSPLPMSQISPDGKRLAIMVATGSRIWLRTIESGDVQPIEGSDEAMGLFWSPDSRHLAFTSSSALKKLTVSDSTIQTLCDACQPAGGGTWSRGGTILFPTLDGALHGIPAAGGAPQVVTRPDPKAGEIAHLAPYFLPGRERFLYLIRNADEGRSGLYLGDVGSAERHLVLQSDVPAIYAADGYLLFARNRTLLAQRFDVARPQLIGDARPLVRFESAGRSPFSGQPAFSVSDSGVLTYGMMARPVTQFQWVGRGGEPQQALGEPAVYYTFDLSQDDSRLAYTRIEEGSAHLWVRDLTRDVASRLTSGDSFYADPRWVDSERLVATRYRPAPHAIVEISLDGSESTIRTSGSVIEMVDSVSRDGQYLLYRPRGERLMALPLGEAVEPFLVRTIPAGFVNQAQFDPANRWIAYQAADESGRFDVYVTPFSGTGAPRKVSAAGGVQPVWRSDGRELYYLSLDGMLNVVEVLSDDPFWLSPSKALFPTPVSQPSASIEEFAASADGQRFLLLKPIDKPRGSIGVVVNWPALLRHAR